MSGAKAERSPEGTEAEGSGGRRARVGALSWRLVVCGGLEGVRCGWGVEKGRGRGILVHVRVHDGVCSSV